VSVNSAKIFNENVNELNNANSDRSFFLDNERYDIILREVKEAQILRKNNQPLTSKHYRRLKRYDVTKISDTEKLTEADSGENDDSNIRYYSKTEELFDVLETAHINTGHKRTQGNTIIIIIIIIVVVTIIINCKWVCTQWQWYYNRQQTQNTTYTHTHTHKKIHNTQN
jgi:hypothetical protein